MILHLKCTECDEEVEVNRPYDYDGPDFCPECRSVDCFDEIEGEE